MEYKKVSLQLKRQVLLAALVAWAVLGVRIVCAATGDELALALRQNVVKITSEWGDGYAENGFGFIVGARPGEVYIVTANHVVRRVAEAFSENEGPATRIRIEYFSRRGEIFDAKLLATSSAENDLAVLRAPVPDGLSWRKEAVSPDEAERAMPVWFVGRTGDWYVPSSPGAVNGIGLDNRIAADNLNVQVGTSGAPLIGENGILGMIVEEAGGIAYALPIAYIEQAFRIWNHPWQLAALPGAKIGETKSDGTCRIAGLVFDSDTNRPLSGVWLDLYRAPDENYPRPKRLQAGVATTGPDGRFSINCGGVADDAFPLLLAVRHRDWLATHITGQSIAFKDRWDGINIALATKTFDRRENRADPDSRSDRGGSGAEAVARGEALYKRGDFRAAYPLFKSAAESGNGKAAYYLGTMYLNGRGVTKNEKEAVKWISRSARKGEAEGLFLMGTLYARGIGGLEASDRRAASYYLRAAKAGSVRAYWQLGIRYERGQGVPRDLKQAIVWYEMAAKAGNSAAERALARLGVRGK